MLFLPVFRQVYIGILCNASSEHLGYDHLDHSSWEAVLWSLIFALAIVGANYWVIGIVWVVAMVERAVAQYYLFKLHSNHAWVWACFSFLPFVVFIRSSEVM